MGVRAFTYLAILLLVGIGVEWLYWTYAYALRAALHSAAGASPRQALRRPAALLPAPDGLVLFRRRPRSAPPRRSRPRGVRDW